MARTCRLSFGGRSGPAEWSFGGSYLTVTPEQGGPITVAVPEIAGIAGDGYELLLSLPAQSGAAGTTQSAGPGAAGGVAGVSDLVLTHLGAEGPTLLEGLRREWVPARAKVLRLGGSGEGRPFTGCVMGLGDEPGAANRPSQPAGVPEPFHALLFEDVLVVAREGRDLEPVFLALVGAIDLDEPDYAVRLRQWPRQEVVFSRMAGQTEEFLRNLRANRALLAEESGTALASMVPLLPAGLRAALAGMWLPGRLLELEAMEAVCPGFHTVFHSSLLPGLLRHDEGAHLLRWASGGSSWLGCTRETAASSGETGDEGYPLWLLCGKGGVWFLEALSSQDRATYCFSGGEDTPVLMAKLLCAPQFSREALHSPPEEFEGDKAGLTIPAQSLGFLVELRSRFQDRVIHRTLEGWRGDVERLAGSPAD
ncbi:MAG: hypothetical protein JXA87_11560 [Thermoleophilia bacterium]|nr:hypothetical protein [Thermoleophilia bacterium]